MTKLGICIKGDCTDPRCMEEVDKEVYPSKRSLSCWSYANSGVLRKPKSHTHQALKPMQLFREGEVQAAKEKGRQ